MTWRQFAFYYNLAKFKKKKKKKRISETHFTFQKETTGQYGHLGDMPWCPHHCYSDGGIKWALRKTSTTHVVLI